MSCSACSVTGTSLSTGQGGELPDNSDVKVIIPLSLLRKLQLALSEEQAESARKDERISTLHALLGAEHQPSLQRVREHDVADERRCLYHLLELTRVSVDFHSKRSKELEQILIPLLDPDNRRWHFPYTNSEEFVTECVQGLAYIKLNLSSGGVVHMVLLENAFAPDT